MPSDARSEIQAEVLRPREAARYVGLSRPTIDRWRKAGKFPQGASTRRSGHWLAPIRSRSVAC